MRVTVPRLLAATPDAITSAIYLTAWTAPSTLGAPYVKNLMLVMLIEFIVIHSTGFYAGITAVPGGRGMRVLLLTALSAFYMIFISAFALAFDSTWPLFAFGWLFVCRFFHIWMRPQGAPETLGMAGLWAVSVATYVLGAMLTVMLPLPALGITADFISSMQLSGGGEWVERPYTVLAFGTLYFAVQALAKFAATAPQRPNAAH